MTREKGLTKQIQDILDSKLKIGHSKFEDKKLGITDKHIYSWSTYRTYLKHGCYFGKWSKSAHGCKNLVEARQYVNEYLKMRINAKLSPYTQKLEAAVLAKIYGCSTEDFIKTEVRHRSEITRSRGQKTRDKHFSEEKNKEFVEFCKATGLRRSELKTLKGDQLTYDEMTKTYNLIVVGKGGRIRESPILSVAAIERIHAAGNHLVWEKIPNGADIHSYRAEYCTSLYRLYARPKNKIPINDRYCCRGNLKGIWYDKKAMEIATRALGHNRISVIAGHYIRED